MKDVEVALPGNTDRSRASAPRPTDEEEEEEDDIPARQIKKTRES